MKSLFLVLAVFSLFLQTSFAQKPAQKCFFQTDIELAGISGGLSEAEFNDALDVIDEVYAPIFKKQGLSLKIIRDWKSDFINASAEPTHGKIAERNITMNGGLARHPKMTSDGFKVIACHEMGHHIGGAPLYNEPVEIVKNNTTDEKYNWYASSEGQSDYFASTKCARKVFARDNNREIVSKMKVAPFVKERCTNNYSDAEEAAICQRTAMAGDVITKVWAELWRMADPSTKDPNIETPSELVVKESIVDKYPSLQCRTDTFLEGALCHIDHRKSFSVEDVDAGACSRRLGDRVGMRPLCWFKPKN